MTQRVIPSRSGPRPNSIGPERCSKVWRPSLLLIVKRSMARVLLRESFVPLPWASAEAPGYYARTAVRPLLILPRRGGGAAATTESCASDLDGAASETGPGFFPPLATLCGTRPYHGVN